MLATTVALVGAITGYATYYNPGIFDEVWSNRQHQMAPCTECVGYAAMEDPKYLDSRIYLSNGKEWIGPLHVIDCGLMKYGRIVEVDYWLAERWGMAGVGPILVTLVFAEDYHGQDHIVPSGEYLPARHSTPAPRPVEAVPREVPDCTIIYRLAGVFAC